MALEDEFTAAPGRAPESLRVWLVHDWLTGMRGGEKVLRELVRLFPSAKIATLFCIPGAVDPEIQQRVCATSFLQRVPHIGRIYRRLLPVFPEAIRSISIDACDLVISTSHCVAKGIGAPRGVPHLCYCFTPMRYVWETAGHYFADRPGLARRMAGAAAGPLRDADLQMNEGVTRFATTCRNVAGRIRRCYGREADVVYPGIDDIYMNSEQHTGRPAAHDYYLLVSALVAYKRVDLAVQAFAQDRQHKLLIIGKGPDEARLRALAGGSPNITFSGGQSESELCAAYSACRALVFPGEEDFGLVPLEAQACGRPVIAYGAGGVLETVLPPGAADGPTGLFFQEQTPTALTAAIHEFETCESEFVPDRLRRHARQFGWPQFHQGIAGITGQLISQR